MSGEFIYRLKPKAYTEADLKRAFAKRQQKKAKANEMLSHPDAPNVFAPRHMWKGGKP